MCMNNIDDDIIKGISLVSDMTNSGFKFFDRIEGLMYPGQLVSSRRESSKTDMTCIATFGYESGYINPLRNFGDFIQSSGKLRLETFKASNCVPDGTIDIGFEFMNVDNNTYSFDEMVIWWAYYNGTSVSQFKSANLKLVGGIKNSTRIILTRFGIKYHYECIDTAFNGIKRDMYDIDKDKYIPMAFEVYIK